MKPMAEAIGERDSGYRVHDATEAAMKPMAEAIGELPPLSRPKEPDMPAAMKPMAEAIGETLLTQALIHNMQPQ